MRVFFRQTVTISVMAVFILACGAVSRADSVGIVKDINTSETFGGSMICAGETVFFASGEKESGLELWRSNGTDGGTTMVMDIWPGPPSSNPQNFATSGSVVYFIAADPEHGLELWKSDGTAQGTGLVKDIWPGKTPSSPANLILVGTTLYFTANDGVHGTELWKSDGSAAGTVLVKDIRTGLDSSAAHSLTAANTRLYLVADNGSSGFELWRSDGTEAGTFLVKDIYAGSTSGCSAGSWYRAVIDDTIYFTATDASTGQEIWKSDGTEAGTILLKDIFPGSYGSNTQSMAVADGVLYFGALGDWTTNCELWKSDGTEAGTVLVKDIHPSSGSWPYSITPAGSSVFFTATTPSNGQELWKSDGTDEGTTLVLDICPGSTSGNIQYLTVCGTTLFFRANDGTHGDELWKSDGTSAGTEMVQDICSGVGDSSPQNFAVAADAIYFQARNTSGDVDLWRSDGTAGGTFAVKDVVFKSLSAEIASVVRIGTSLFFCANDWEHGKELWKSDGTEAGTVLVKDINPGSAGSEPRRLVDVSGTLLFSANDGTHGRELWKSDGTEAGTVLVRDIYPGTTGSDLLQQLAVGSVLYFSAEDGSHGRELWKSNGTEAGTVLVKDVCPGASPGLINSINMTAVGNTLFFDGSNGNAANGMELWKSDGTEAGTVMVKDIYPGSTSSQPGPLGTLGSTVFFRAYTLAAGQELWKSDGTDAGTVMVKDILPGSDSGDPQYFGAFGSAMFFIATNGTKFSLWKSDGTDAGTVQVQDVGMFSTMINAGSLAYFPGASSSYGTEVWRTDGSTAGTVMIKDVNPGASSGFLTGLGRMSLLNSTLYFMGQDPLHGVELWKTDGTDSGTTIVCDNNPGAAYSAAENQVPLGDQLCFVSTDGFNTYELWQTILLPGAPSGAYADSVTTGSITWRWSDNADNETGFRAYCDEGAGAPATLRAMPSPNSTAWVQTGLEANVQCTFQVAAANSGGCSERSEPATTWTLAAAPLAPVLANPSDSTIDVGIAPGDGNSPATEYAIYVDTTAEWLQGDGSRGGAPVWRTASQWAGVTAIGLSRLTGYTFSALARNGAGVVTDPSPDSSLATVPVRASRFIVE